LTKKSLAGLMRFIDDSLVVGVQKCSDV